MGMHGRTRDTRGRGASGPGQCLVPASGIQAGHTGALVHQQAEWRNLDEQRYESARAPVALLRDALSGEDRNGAALDKTTTGLAGHLLIRCVDPADLENELSRIDGFLVEWIADTLLDGIDWDAQSWSG
jgi:hypothetical protein